MELELDAKGLCKVIAQCRESGVSLKYGELVVSLDPNFVGETHQINVDETVQQPGVVDMTVFDKIAERGQDQDFVADERERMDNLLLEDPVEYEKLQAEGEFDHKEEIEDV